MKQLWKLTVVLLIVLLVTPWSFASVLPGKGGAMAKLSEGHGTIFKRGFVDWTKETWGAPVPANIGDELYEGMQLGTGDKSWAQITWPNVTTRAWANTVVAVAPNQRIVYLLGGEVLFNLKKDRKDKGDYVIWTKVLQARIRGTTVLLQASQLVSRLCVLEGVVDVMNRLDHSVVRVTPGVVYEIRHNPIKGSQLPNPSNMNRPLAHEGEQRDGNHPLAQVTAVDEKKGNLPEREPLANKGPLLGLLDANEAGPMGSGLTQTSAHQVLQADGSSLSPMVVEGRPALSLFETSNSISTLYIADADKLGHHPLISQFDSTLESMPLITTSLSKLPDVCHLNSAGDHLLGSGNSPGNAQASTLVGGASSNQLLGSSSMVGVNPQLENGPIGTSVPALPDLKGTDKVLADGIEVLRVPTLMSYKVGPLMGSQVSLPQGTLNFWTPSGVIGRQESMPNQFLQSQNIDRQPVVGGVSSVHVKKDNLNSAVQYLASPEGLTSPMGPVNLSVYKQFNNIPPGFIHGLSNGEHSAAVGQVPFHQFQHQFGFTTFDLMNNFGDSSLLLNSPLKDTSGGGLPPPPNGPLLK